MAAGAQSWAVTIRSLRTARGWTQVEAAQRLRHHTTEVLPELDSLLRRWKSWEGGHSRPSACYARLVAAVLGTVTDALFPPVASPADTRVLAATGMDTLEVLSRLQRSSVDDATMHAVRVTVETLSSEYSSRPAADLLIESRRWLHRLAGLLDGGPALRHHRDILELAGWLVLLIGCLEHDLGDVRSAEASRRAALGIGVDIASPAILGWAHEMRSWFALTTGDLPGVLAAARAGQEAAGRDPVAVQLLAQEAKANARLGRRTAMERSLENGRDLLDSLPYPGDVGNHFVVDPTKWDFYAMDCYRHVQETALSAALAEGVLRADPGVTHGGGVRERSPMRNAEARITLAVAAVREGDLGAALVLGHQAIGGPRRSLPSLTLVAGDLVRVLTETYPGDPRIAAFRQAVHGVAVAASA